MPLAVQEEFDQYVQYVFEGVYVCWQVVFIVWERCKCELGSPFSFLELLARVGYVGCFQTVYM